VEVNGREWTLNGSRRILNGRNWTQEERNETFDGSDGIKD
jgi:hypothetical protein